MIAKAEHIGIMVSDLNRSVAFYRDILGLPLVEQLQTETGLNIAFMQVGDIQLELIANSQTPYHKGDGIVNHVAFTVSDLDAAMDHLRKHNVELISQKPIPIWDGKRVAFFRGPDGEKLEFFERKP